MRRCGSSNIVYTVVAYLAMMGLKRRIGGSFGDVAANRKIWWLINPVCESVNFYWDSSNWFHVEHIIFVCLPGVFNDRRHLRERRYSWASLQRVSLALKRCFDGGNRNILEKTYLGRKYHRLQFLLLRKFCLWKAGFLQQNSLLCFIKIISIHYLISVFSSYKRDSEYSIVTWHLL